jgi:hypothetical protein
MVPKKVLFVTAQTKQCWNNGISTVLMLDAAVWRVTKMLRQSQDWFERSCFDLPLAALERAFPL